ncbi:hypothetical protein [Methanolobus sp. WCC5]|uniref:hypothetical protein n=1 Tax=Methanolobus sp. WCC5 TaxID=3125785 RepID=UPI00324F48DF
MSVEAVRQHLKTARTYRHVEMNGTGNKFCKYELTDSGQSYVRNHMNEIEAI